MQVGRIVLINDVCFEVSRSVGLCYFCCENHYLVGHHPKKKFEATKRKTNATITTTTTVSRWRTSTRHSTALIPPRPPPRRRRKDIFRCLCSHKFTFTALLLVLAFYSEQMRGRSILSGSGGTCAAATQSCSATSCCYGDCLAIGNINVCECLPNGEPGCHSNRECCSGTCSRWFACE